MPDRERVPERVPESPVSHPGEPGIGPDLAPPFTAEDEATRWLFALNRKGIRPGLVRVEGLLADLGHPERRLTTLVTAGTNGKGSTTRMLARLLQSAGLRVATYTSPHLLRVHERLLIDDRPIDADTFARQVDAMRGSVERHEASWFETLTAVSVQLAADAGVDVLCAETGLGGRLDATNALPAAATLLTTVDLDHQHILGETREQILDEKLGLLEAGTPFFSAIQPELNAQAFRAAIGAGSPAYFLDEITRTEEAADHWRLVLRERVIDGLPLLGSATMRRNAALALLCLDTLAQAGRLPLPDDPAAALAGLFLPGRLQTVFTRPDVVVDTGHNAQALLGTLTWFLERPVRGRRIVIFGGMQDKAVPRELGQSLNRCDAVTFAPISLPRSRDRENLRGLWADLELPVPAGHSIVDSVAAALAYWGPRLRADDALLVTGSGFLVAETLHRLGVRDLEETRRPRPATDVLPG